MKLPTIEILFKQLASSIIARSQRGIAIVIVKDDTVPESVSKVYTSENELYCDKAKYTPENYQQLADAMGFHPTKLYAVRIGTDKEITDALNLVEGIVKTGWVTMVGEAADYTALADWVKDWNRKGRTYKAVVYQTAADDKHVVNFSNAEVTFRDTRGKQTGSAYLPSLAGILASCNIERGSTSFVCENLLSVTEPSDPEAALTAGELILLNDFDEVKVGRGINSMTTLSGDDIEDMKFIDIVETMDLISDDIRSTFQDTYQGQYKNTLDNQMLFVSAVNTYFTSLASSDNGILDPQYSNTADIDVTAQRIAWMNERPEAETWSDSKVKNTAFKRDVFLMGDIKISGAMENLRFTISMF